MYTLTNNDRRDNANLVDENGVSPHDNEHGLFGSASKAVNSMVDGSKYMCVCGVWGVCVSARVCMYVCARTCVRACMQMNVGHTT